MPELPSEIQPKTLAHLPVDLGWHPDDRCGQAGGSRHAGSQQGVGGGQRKADGTMAPWLKDLRDKNTRARLVSYCEIVPSEVRSTVYSVHCTLYTVHCIV